MLGFIVSVWPNRPKEQSHPRHVTCRSETSSLCIFLGNYRTERGQNTARRSDDNQRIAILPLDNISSDSRDEYFAEGMTEDSDPQRPESRALELSLVHLLSDTGQQPSRSWKSPGNSMWARCWKAV